MNGHNLTMLTDLYQLTMVNGYFKTGTAHRVAVFDLFFRRLPWGNGYALAAGLEQVIEYLRELRFTADDLAYLRSLQLFSEEFLDYLGQMRFTGDIDAVVEGTPVFPGEPLVRVRAPIAQAQLLETTIANIINHQTLIATKAARVMEAAGDTKVMEFGLRRAQGPDAGLYGSRAAFIGGCQSTSNVLAGQLYDIPVAGTHAHSWVMSFPDELTAFRAYAKAYPHACLLLVDTYDTIRSGVPNAIRVAKELEADGNKLLGIRLDSGDLAYLSKVARQMLDDAGLEHAIIVGSGDLDENIIRDLRMQGAKIDSWGVGTKLITGDDNPALGGVYKLVALEENGQLVPKIKVSENAEKTTNPGVKDTVRFYSLESGKALADLIIFADEQVPPHGPLTIFDPVDTWKRKTLRDYDTERLLEPIFRGGKQVYECPSVQEIQKHARKQLEHFWPEYKRPNNPEKYIVDLSEELWNRKHTMIRELRASYAENH
ncbi:MAG: nicotinate phosphoribosyltransferase [Firmicutes bacterium]|jgi:nicotinate phosphoribosyltransferase|nr:nicotinate phosphoribosyltransferase [Bacillota bacterium]